MKNTFARWRTQILICSVFFGTLALSGASSCSSSSKTVDFTILHTNDIHSHMIVDRGFESNPYGLGGLAKMKTLINQIRAAKPSILLDAGDFSEGISPYQVDGGSDMLRIMSAMGYNAAVIGNHDFLNGPSEMASMVQRATPNFSVLGANMILSNPAISSDAARIQSWVKPYVILPGPSGLRIAVVGLLCEDFFYYSYFQPGVIQNTITAATAITNQIHSQNLADVIVLLSHNSFSQNLTLAQQVPWVNVVISGHTHMKTPLPYIMSNAGQNVYVAETGAWGQFLGEMTLTYDFNRKQVTLKSFSLDPVAPTLVDDPTVAGLVDSELAKLSTRYGHDIFQDQVATTNDVLVQIDNSVKETPIANFVAEAFRAAGGTPIGVTAGFTINLGLSPGSLRTFDLINLADHVFHPLAGQLGSFPGVGETWTVKTLPFPGSAFKRIFNFLLNFADTLGVGPLALSGVQIVYDPSQGLNAISSISIKDPVSGTYTPMLDDQTYLASMDDGILGALATLNQLPAGLGIPLDLTGVDVNQATDTGIQNWQAVVNYANALGGQIRAADFAPGVRYRTVGEDLGVYEHAISFVTNADGSHTIQVLVQNEGMTDYHGATTGPLMLHTLRSNANDSTHDATGGETIVVGSDLRIPDLAAGTSTTLSIPWPSGLPGGVYSVLFQITGAQTGQELNTTNNSAHRHFQL